MNNSLAIFVNKANELIETKLILADKAITNMLKCVAACPPLLECIKLSLAEQNYATEFVRCRAVITLPDGTTVCKLKTPTTMSRLFTFVMCLLAEFDGGLRSLTDFLEEYYHADNPNESYAQFADQFLRPFKRAGENILQSVDPGSFNVKDEQLAERYFDAEHIYISGMASEKLLAILDKIQTRVKGEAFFSQQDKQDCDDITTAMMRAIQLKNPRLLSIVWIGFKNTLAPIKSVEGMVKALHDLLIENNLV